MIVSNEYSFRNHPKQTIPDSNTSQKLKRTIVTNESICILYWTSDAITMIMVFNINKVVYFKQRTIFDFSILWWIITLSHTYFRRIDCDIFHIAKCLDGFWFCIPMVCSIATQFYDECLARYGYCKFDHELYFVVAIRMSERLIHICISYFLHRKNCRQ